MSALPTATYRLQLHRDFNFDRAAAVVPYLAALGVSHCYVSPILKARAGSLHGYDIVDHTMLNPELGDGASFDRLVRCLRQYDMGLIVDFVPNHMGVGGDDNAWWLDVLEHGAASPCATYFDIDWQPIKSELRGKVLLPVLGDHYGSVLESGALRLEFDVAAGSFSFRYYQHRFPLDPASYRQLLAPLLLEGALASVAEELRTLVRVCSELPGRDETAGSRCATAAIMKDELAALCRRVPELAAAIEVQVAAINGRPGEPQSFDRFNELLEWQAYRLAYWRVAADEINYRRFTDVNELAGLRMERPEVFAATHHFIMQLAAEGKVQGLRLDHPDGLADPAAYCERLRQALAERGVDVDNFYLVLEKVLLGNEQLPPWSVHGTTGYDFCNQVSHVLLHAPAERTLTRIYHRVVGTAVDFDTLLYRSARKIIEGRLSSELTVLANLLNALAQGDRHTRDFTLNGLRRALVALVAEFPVYRTYITAAGASEDDRNYLAQAVTRAKARRRLDDEGTFDFIHRLLTLEQKRQMPLALHGPLLRFVQRFQQYTAPVVAKSLEDTAFYRYYRLAALNEVGGDPRQFGLSRRRFHAANQQRLEQWPYAMLTTSTHDSKRSGDVRARSGLIAELPEQWRQRLARWRRANRVRRSNLQGNVAPSRNDEYLFYQTLLGSWPTQTNLAPHELDAYRERIVEYMRKAAREAKECTSWFTPDAAYEAALEQFVQRALRPSRRNTFLADFMPFARQLLRPGLYAALSQRLLQLTVPGVPDIYQGDEGWWLRLVDPDNRVAIDFNRLQATVDALQQEEPSPAWLRQLVERIADGRAKFYLTCKVLNLRRRLPALFQQGDYQPLWAQGEREAHVIAFARRREGAAVLTVAPRWFARLPGAGELPSGAAVWGETLLPLAPDLAGLRWRNLLSGAAVPVSDGALRLAEVLADFPVALLVAGVD